MKTLFMVALVLVGCAKKEEAVDEAPSTAPRIADAEADRGRKACQAYVDQVCECAL